MSISSDGLLWFGVAYSSDDDPWKEGESVDRGDLAHDAESAWDAEFGPERPSAEDCNGPEWEAWREAKRVWDKTGTGIDCWIHCSFDYAEPYVAIRALHFKAHRGFPIALGTALPVPTTEQLAALKAFMEKHDLPAQEPQWHLASLVG